MASRHGAPRPWEGRVEARAQGGEEYSIWPGSEGAINCDFIIWTYNICIDRNKPVAIEVINRWAAQFDNWRGHKLTVEVPR